MKLSDVTQLIESSRTMLDELDPGASGKLAAGLDIATEIAGTLSDAQAALLQANVKKARQLVDALGEEMEITPEERKRYAEDQIRSLEEAFKNAGGRQKIILKGKLRQAKINQAALLAADVFRGFVVFSDEERQEIGQLMEGAEKDLQKRKQLAAAIGIGVNVLKTGLSIAKKVSTAGLA